MSKTHYSNFGSFGRIVRRFADTLGFVEYDESATWDEYTEDQLLDITEDTSEYSLYRAGAALELARRDVARWRAAN